MRQNLSIILMLLLIKFSPFSLAQQATYTVTRAPFSSQKYDEFSPVYYNNGIVFCSNRKPSLLVTHSDSLNRGPLKIYFIDTTGRKEWRKPKLFSKDLTTVFNDGPVTFNAAGDTVYYSRNLIVDRKLDRLPGPKNRLGIFYAVKDSNNWARTREMRINNEWYNVTTPWLSPDGHKLFFASDKSDGFGGSDIYYCQWKTDHWENPVNLGPVINTPGNEAYPFINEAGELFFSSDGHKGYGGKDIFFSRPSGTAWLPPVPLDPPVNSEKDDFGFIMDQQAETGYFSSESEGSVDIFQFRVNYPQLYYPEEQRSNIYCYRFIDTLSLVADPSRMQNEWDFGDGQRSAGTNASHCFPGPGNYTVKHFITDRKTGRTVFVKLMYDLEIKDIEQPFISSAEAALSADSIAFDSAGSHLPGYEIIGCTWDMGDSTRINGGAVKHIYDIPGEYTVKMGLKLRKTGTGIITHKAVSKKIRIFAGRNELDSFNDRRSKESAPVPAVNDYDHAFINIRYAADEQIMKDAVFRVELFSSAKRINPDNENFRKAGQKYSIREIFSEESGIYSYVAAEEFSFMTAFIEWSDITAMGFRDAVIKTALLTDPAERELNTLKKVYGLSSDILFEKKSQRIAQAGFALLDQIATLMKKYPAVRLAVEVHTDEPGSDAVNRELSEKRAKGMIDYLSERGINPGRVTARGLGNLTPVAGRESEDARKVNSRVQFYIMH